MFKVLLIQDVSVPKFKKGDPDETDNYRGTTLMSCMLKISTTILKIDWLNGLKIILI